MANEQGQRRNSRGRLDALDQSGNNVYPPDRAELYHNVTSFSRLDDSAQDEFLRDRGFLFGVRIDGNDGPRRGARQAARYTSTLPPLIQEMNNIDSEVITTENNRDANYAHKGWLLPALSNISPWTLSRITRNNHQENPVSRSITKHIMIQKLRIDLDIEDVSPVSELEAHLRQALARPTRFEKANAIYRVLQYWGDLIPLEFDIGVAVAVTDLESFARDYLADRSYLGVQRLSTSATARVSTRGGDLVALQSDDDIRTWLSRPVPLSQWEQIRVIRAAPLISMLDNELQSQIMGLHQSLITYCPTTAIEIASNATSFDGFTHAFNTVSKVGISFGPYGDYISTIFLTYVNEPRTKTYGVAQQVEQEFTLRHGEHITDVLIWKETTDVCGIQFSTSQGRTSRHFGSQRGSPSIMRSSGGYLSGFSGMIAGQRICDLQTIWRHDLPYSGLSGDREFTPYVGGNHGKPFNDWPFVKHSNSAHIASIRVRCGESVASGIQMIYRDFGAELNASTSQQGDSHGYTDGNDYTFHLSPDEHIVTITGKYGSGFQELSFVTNIGKLPKPLFC